MGEVPVIGINRLQLQLPQEDFMATLTYTLLPLLPLVIWLLSAAWSPSRMEGDTLLTVPIPVLARLKMLALPFTAGILVFVVIAIAIRAHWLSLPILMLAVVLVLSIPINYTLTTVGICSGRGRFRRWTEFAGVRRSATGAILQGGPRSSSYPIFLSGNRDDDEFLLTLKNLILDSYKGTDTELRRQRRRGYRR